MAAIDSIMKLNRVQKYLLNEFKEDLDEEQFNLLKEHIQGFLNQNALEGRNKAELTVNWVNDKVYNEMLNQAVRELAKAYFKIAYNYSTHADVEMWNRKERDWREYGRNIKNMVIGSKEEIQGEIDRILAEYKTVLETEKSVAR